MSKNLCKAGSGLQCRYKMNLGGHDNECTYNGECPQKEDAKTRLSTLKQKFEVSEAI